MKKTKFLTAVLIAIMMIFAVSANAVVNATESTEDESQIQPRDVEDVETDDADAVMPISEEDQDADVVADDEEYQDTIDNVEYEFLEDDLYVATGDSDYEMSQIVNGNVFILGNNVKITGIINGSLFVCANNVEITEDASIGIHTFIAANNVTVNGLTSDMYVACQNLTFGDEAMIYRDVRAIAEKIYLSGMISRNAFLYANTIEVPEEDGQLTIYGNLNYESPTEIENLDKAVISGEIKYNQYEETEESGNIVVDKIISAIGTIVFDIILYIAFVFFAPKFVAKAKDYVSVKGVLALVFGLAFLVLMPILMIILLMTSVGMALSGILLLVYIVVLMLNAFVVALAANEFIAEKIGKFADDKLKKGLTLIPVSLVLWLIRQIPAIGTLISAIVLLAGIGIIVSYQVDSRKKETKE